MHHWGNLLISAAMDHSAKRVAKYRPLFVKATEGAIGTWAESRRGDLKRKMDALEAEEEKLLAVAKKVKR